jgi:guanylate kinase
VSARLVVLSSPSGTGKTTIARRILAARDDVAFSVSATTRPPRPRERDGRDYHFLSRDEFVARRDRGEFLEWAAYGDHLYGTLRASVDTVLAAGRHVLLDIEVQGAAQVRTHRDDVVTIFVLPPSAEVLLRRLRGRGSEGPSQVAARVARARRELEEATRYDHVVVNDVLERAVAAVDAIIDGRPAETVPPQQVEQRVEELRRHLAADVIAKER